MITPDGIGILNAARKILERVDKQAMTDGWNAENGVSLGRVAEAADTAAGAIFNFLNVASNYGNVEMSYEQLHGRPQTKEVEV